MEYLTGDVIILREPQLDFLQMSLSSGFKLDVSWRFQENHKNTRDYCWLHRQQFEEMETVRLHPVLRRIYSTKNEMSAFIYPFRQLIKAQKSMKQHRFVLLPSAELLLCLNARLAGFVKRVRQSIKRLSKIFMFIALLLLARKLLVTFTRSNGSRRTDERLWWKCCDIVIICSKKETY